MSKRWWEPRRGVGVAPALCPSVSPGLPQDGGQVASVARSCFRGSVSLEEEGRKMHEEGKGTCAKGDGIKKCKLAVTKVLGYKVLLLTAMLSFLPLVHTPAGISHTQFTAQQVGGMLLSGQVQKDV